jgi:hypothetical protein
MNQRFTLILAVVLVAGIYSCTPNKKDPNGDPITLQPYELDYETAKLYVNNYSDRAGYVDSTAGISTEIDKRKKRPQTRCVWFSTARLKNMIDSIEHEGGDGIRFYLATYSDQYPVKELKKDQPPAPEEPYWGHNTLLMVSTKLDSASAKSTMPIHKDYYISIPGSNSQGKLHGYMAVPENRGQLCPPPSDCKGIGATLLDN